jgi:hypothetical protein
MSPDPIDIIGDAQLELSEAAAHLVQAGQFKKMSGRTCIAAHRNFALEALLRALAKSRAAIEKLAADRKPS